MVHLIMLQVDEARPPAPMSTDNVTESEEGTMRWTLVLHRTHAKAGKEGLSRRCVLKVDAFMLSHPWLLASADLASQPKMMLIFVCLEFRVLEFGRHYMQPCMCIYY